MTALRVNGKDHAVDADPNMPLLWALRSKDKCYQATALTCCCWT